MMKLYTVVLSGLLALALAGCDNGPWDAPPNSQIKDIEDIKVAWFGCGTDAEPGCVESGAVVFPLTAIVVDQYEEPLNNVRVTYASGWNEIYLLPREVIEALALPDTERWTEIADSGQVWAQFSGNLEADYYPTFFEGWTEGNGTAEVWVWIDSMPTDAQTGQAKEAGILIDIGVDQLAVKLQPSQ